MPKMLKGTGDFHPPEDLDPPECDDCSGMGRVWDVPDYGYVGCDTCGGTGREPAPDFEPDFDPEHDTPPYEGP